VADAEEILRILLEAKNGSEDYNDKAGNGQLTRRQESLGDAGAYVLFVLLKRGPNADITANLRNIGANPQLVERILEVFGKRGITVGSKRSTYIPNEGGIFINPVPDPGVTTLVTVETPHGPLIHITPVAPPTPQCCITLAPEPLPFDEFFPAPEGAIGTMF
jgi:hypothetical protein